MTVDWQLPLGGDLGTPEPYIAEHSPQFLDTKEDMKLHLISAALEVNSTKVLLHGSRLDLQSIHSIQIFKQKLTI